MSEAKGEPLDSNHERDDSRGTPRFSTLEVRWMS